MQSKQILTAVLVLGISSHALAQSSSLYQRDLPGTGRELTLEATSFYYQKAEPVRVLKLNDIVRVRVVESSTVNSEGNINRRKQYQLQAQLIDWVKFNNGDLETNPNSTGDPTINGVYQGQGQARSNLNTKEGMQFAIAARIVDIRPNGHLVIEAHSTIRNNDEIWDQALSGIVPPERVDPKGEVRSEDIADRAHQFHHGVALPGFADQRPGDEGAHGLRIDAVAAAGQGLELFVGIGQAVPAHHRLHGLGQVLQFRQHRGAHALALLLEGASHGRPEPRQPLLEDVVGGAAFHALDGGFLVECDGEDDDGDVRAAGFGHGDGVEAIVAGEGIVGEDEVRREGVEGLSESFASGDAVGLTGKLHAVELSEDQLLVGL